MRAHDESSGRDGRCWRPRRPIVHGDEAGFGLVEAMVAILVLSIGLLGIASMALGTAGHRHRASVRSDQAILAQDVIEEARNQGFSAVTSGTETKTIRGVSYQVERTVTQSGDVKELRIVVGGQPQASPDTFWTRIDRGGTYPTSP